MHKGWIFAPALAALVIGGCGQDAAGSAEGTDAKVAPRAGAMVKGIYVFRNCAPTNIQGKIKITIPNKITGENIQRIVKHKKGTGQYVDNGNNPKEPFDAYLEGTTFGNVGHAEVRVVIKNSDKWRFHIWKDPADPANQFFGVGTNDPTDDTLCATIPTGTPSPSPSPSPTDSPDEPEKLVAVFYIDLAAMAKHDKGYAAPFTIGVVAGGTAAGDPLTPIFIDPKVHNDGGGLTDP